MTMRQGTRANGKIGKTISAATSTTEARLDLRPLAYDDSDRPNRYPMSVMIRFTGADHYALQGGGTVALDATAEDNCPLLDGDSFEADIDGEGDSFVAHEAQSGTGRITVTRIDRL